LAGGLGIVVGLPLIRTVASLYRIQIRKAGGLLNDPLLRLIHTTVMCGVMGDKGVWDGCWSLDLTPLLERLSEGHVDSMVYSITSIMQAAKQSEGLAEKTSDP
ncbi:hypothetical protein KCV03_g319, partial [Aureobasidium melanogenum]